MLNEEVAKYRELSGDTNPNTPISRIGGYLDGYEKALEQEPCEDAISRTEVIKSIDEREDVNGKVDAESVRTDIVLMPSVNPTKTGHWIYKQYDGYPECGNWQCSECRCVVVECVGKEEKGGIPLYKYCPQCGAKMEVSE